MTYRPYNTIKASGIELSYENGSGAEVTKGTPLRIKSDGTFDYIDPSVEAEVLSIGGCASTDISIGARGGVINAGRIENITTTAAFGDSIWLSKSGGLTNVRPEIGVGGFLAGDFVVRVGTIAKNETFPLQKDLVLELRLIGQLAV